MDTSSFFDFYYNNAEVNSILIMDRSGTVLEVNKAFTNNFGYSATEIGGQNFDILFTEKDREENKPGLELATVLSTGQAHDESYVLDKEGQTIWCTGESMLVAPKEGEQYIIKDIINLQAKKQVQLFLIETEELLERIFDSSKDTAMLLMDGHMKVLKANRAFRSLFELTEAPLLNSSISELDHQFWNREDVKSEIRNSIVKNEPLTQKEFTWATPSGQHKEIRVSSKIIHRGIEREKKVFIIVEEVTPRLPLQEPVKSIHF